jgi:hypothetical protein
VGYRIVHHTIHDSSNQHFPPDRTRIGINAYYELRNNRRAHFLDTSWIVSRFELDTRIRPNLKCDLVRVLTN